MLRGPSEPPWNSLESDRSGTTGPAGSISLVGFGVDSFIEVSSGSALLWRMSWMRACIDEEAVGGAAAGSWARRSSCWPRKWPLKLSATSLRRAPAHIFRVLRHSLIVMPAFRAKRRIRTAMQSRAMHADAADRVLCIPFRHPRKAGLLL